MRRPLSSGAARRARAGARGAWMLPLLALLAGCAPQTARVELRRQAGDATAGPAAGQRPRLAWIAWEAEDTVIWCNRRVDDAGQARGVLGPCGRLTLGKAPQRLVSWLNLERPDTRPADAGPWARCTLRLEDAQLVPAARPARLILVAPDGERVLHSFSPDPTLTADAYQLEASFSPGGTHLAIVELAIGLGEGERTVEVSGVRMIPVPACP